MAAMVMLTFIVGVIAVKTRFGSVKRGDVSPRYFKLMQGDNIPEAVTKTTRCFNNQFEVPVLFYAGCTLSVSLGAENALGIVLAWTFVGLRCIHAYIHLTYNHIMHRIVAFWLAFMSAVAFWVNLVVHQL
jgi:hypothetical protein